MGLVSKQVIRNPAMALDIGDFKCIVSTELNTLKPLAYKYIAVTTSSIASKQVLSTSGTIV